MARPDPTFREVWDKMLKRDQDHLASILGDILTFSERLTKNQNVLLTHILLETIEEMNK